MLVGCISFRKMSGWIKRSGYYHESPLDYEILFIWKQKANDFFGYFMNTESE